MLSFNLGCFLKGQKLENMSVLFIGAPQRGHRESGGKRERGPSGRKTMLVLEPRAKWAAHTPGVCHTEGTPAGQLPDTGANTSACLATECFQGKARSALQVGVVETHAHIHMPS